MFFRKIIRHVTSVLKVIGGGGVSPPNLYKQTKKKKKGKKTPQPTCNFSDYQYPNASGKEGS